MSSPNVSSKVLLKLLDSRSKTELVGPQHINDTTDVCFRDFWFGERYSHGFTQFAKVVRTSVVEWTDFPDKAVVERFSIASAACCRLQCDKTYSRPLCPIVFRSSGFRQSVRIASAMASRSSGAMAIPPFAFSTSLFASPAIETTTGMP